MNSGLKITGEFTLSIKRRDGSQHTLRHKNLIVNWGLINLAKVIGGVAFPSTLSYIALGNSSAAVALGNTALGSELRRDSVTVGILPAPEDNKVQFQKAFAEGAVVGTFTEAGIFDAALDGNMFNRVVFPDFVVGSADTLTLTWLIEIRNQ